MGHTIIFEQKSCFAKKIQSVHLFFFSLHNFPIFSPNLLIFSLNFSDKIQKMCDSIGNLHCIFLVQYRTGARKAENKDLLYTYSTNMFFLQHYYTKIGTVYSVKLERTGIQSDRSEKILIRNCIQNSKVKTKKQIVFPSNQCHNWLTNGELLEYYRPLYVKI